MNEANANASFFLAPYIALHESQTLWVREMTAMQTVDACLDACPGTPMTPRRRWPDGILKNLKPGKGSRVLVDDESMKAAKTEQHVEKPRENDGLPDELAKDLLGVQPHLSQDFPLKAENLKSLDHMFQIPAETPLPPDLREKNLRKGVENGVAADSTLGMEFYRQMKAKGEAVKADYDKSSRAAKAAMRLEWCNDTLKAHMIRRSYGKSFKRVDIKKGTYKPFSRWVQDQGGDQEAVNGCIKGAIKLFKMGAPWVRRNPVTERVEFLDLECGFEEVMEENWSRYEEHSSQNEAGTENTEANAEDPPALGNGNGADPPPAGAKKNPKTRKMTDLDNTLQQCKPKIVVYNQVMQLTNNIIDSYERDPENGKYSFLKKEVIDRVRTLQIAVKITDADAADLMARDVGELKRKWSETKLLAAGQEFLRKYGDVDLGTLQAEITIIQRRADADLPAPTRPKPPPMKRRKVTA